MVICNSCYSNEIEERVWIDLVTGDVKSTADMYFCRSCQAVTDVKVVSDPHVIGEYIEPINNENE